MKKLIMVAMAMVLLLTVDAVPRGPLRWVMIGVSVVLCGSVVVQGVLARRRGGQSWNQALAGDTKLITGSVWWDAALFAAVLLGGVAVVLLIVQL
jgi:hypothetical protein